MGKAKSLRSRVRSYFQDSRAADDKRDLMLEAAHDLATILVDNEHEAMALENNLIKQYKPRYNILLRDDKSYPYIKFTASEKFPRVYVTRRVKKDGSVYFGPYFPANLAYRIVDFIHRQFMVPSCYVDLTRVHPRPCLQFLHRKRCVWGRAQKTLQRRTVMQKPRATPDGCWKAVKAIWCAACTIAWRILRIC